MFRALGRLWPYVLRVRRPFLIGLVWVVLATAVSLVAPWVLKFVIDDLMSGVSRARLAVYAASILGLAIVDGGFRYLMRKYLIGASRELEYRLLNDFYAHLQRLSLSYFQANRTGDLMSRATSDLGAVRMMVGPAVMYFAGTALGFVIALTLMFIIDARLTWLALVPLPGVTIATWYFGKAIHDRFERIQAQLSEMSAVVQEALAGVRVVRAYRQEPAEQRRFRAANDEYVKRNRGLIRLQSAFYPSLTLCFGVSALVVLWFGGRDVMTGRLSLGEFVAFNRYLVLLSWPLIAFGWVINISQRGLASWGRMLEVMDTAPAITDSQSLPAASDSRSPEALAAGPHAVLGRIEIRHLTFRYPGASANALEDVSFVVEPGQTAAIVGATGSGKSTILQLLPRVHEPPLASVFVDGVDVRQWRLARLRAAIGVAPQEPFLFSDTLAANIAFGADRADPLGRSAELPPSREATADRRSLGGGGQFGGTSGTGGTVAADATVAGVRVRVSAAAEAAGLALDVEGFPDGLETMVGERGITLSGGQKQRTSLARALFVDSPILIIDDALSAVDTATEETILRSLRAVRATRTCLIVAHRISTVRDADLILVLHEGRIAERGTHASLVEAGGLYASMYRRQLLEQEIAEA